MKYIITVILNKETLYDEILINCELDEMTEDFSIISAYLEDSKIDILSLLNIEELNQLVIEQLNNL